MKYTEEQKLIAKYYETLAFAALGNEAEFDRIMAEFKRVKAEWNK